MKCNNCKREDEYSGFNPKTYVCPECAVKLGGVKILPVIDTVEKLRKAGIKLSIGE
ncbi:MAG: hypothetical protein MUP27_16265 [Desulfobacterales bacterium]|nr:hypothetical protein [Desulfobacterales bacterium]